MTAPILLLALLLLVAVLVGAYVLWPLLRRPAPAAVAADAATVSRSVLRDRRRELETALAHLPADAPERRAALAEFAAQADDELAAAPAAPAAPPQPPVVPRKPWAAAALAAVLVVPTFGLYLLSGAPESVSPEFAAGPREPASLDELVVDLRSRLAREPKDLDAWRLLGRAELARGRPDDAREAYERAMALAPQDAQVRVDFADALAQTQGAVLEGRPIALIREALALDARNPKALALAGAYEVGRNDYPAAIVLWKRLLEVLPPDSDQAKQVAGFVADLQAGRPPQVAARPAAPGDGRDPQSGPPMAGGAPAAPGGQAGVGPAGGTAAVPADPAASKAAALRGRIDIERRIADRVDPGATVFVVARTLDAEGRPAGPPVAVLRARGSDLPLEFTLDDALAMSPMARLSAVPAGTQVIVLARVSRSGEAAARTGDLQGASQPVKPGATGLRVLIDTVVE